ncbi:hypothetical protein TTRE_0000696401 [Trichuris trichiura]|uniref:Uncharacterized protein n=1 Tax=Trichuris trichiura TaxID=36087 RepID=A0A077ZJC0_TRITR|nr:hypothetical protein TTRE_0000696401 [Trichuris trichiura]
MATVTPSSRYESTISSSDELSEWESSPNEETSEEEDSTSTCSSCNRESSDLEISSSTEESATDEESVEEEEAENLSVELSMKYYSAAEDSNSTTATWYTANEGDTMDPKSISSTEEATAPNTSRDITSGKAEQPERSPQSSERKVLTENASIEGTIKTTYSSSDKSAELESRKSIFSSSPCSDGSGSDDGTTFSSNANGHEHEQLEQSSQSSEQKKLTENGSIEGTIKTTYSSSDNSAELENRKSISSSPCSDGSGSDDGTTFSSSANGHDNNDSQAKSASSNDSTSSSACESTETSSGETESSDDYDQERSRCPTSISDSSSSSSSSRMFSTFDLDSDATSLQCDSEILDIRIPVVKKLRKMRAKRRAALSRSRKRKRKLKNKLKRMKKVVRQMT